MTSTSFTIYKWKLPILEDALKEHGGELVGKEYVGRLEYKITIETADQATAERVQNTARKNGLWDETYPIE